MAKEEVKITVVMLGAYASAQGTVPAGKSISLPEKEANDLIKGGYARLPEPGELKKGTPARIKEQEANVV